MKDYDDEFAEDAVIIATVIAISIVVTTVNATVFVLPIRMSFKSLSKSSKYFMETKASAIIFLNLPCKVNAPNPLCDFNSLLTSHTFSAKPFTLCVIKLIIPSSGR